MGKNKKVFPSKQKKNKKGSNNKQIIKKKKFPDKKLKKPRHTWKSVREKRDHSQKTDTAAANDVTSLDNERSGSRSSSSNRSDKKSHRGNKSVIASRVVDDDGKKSLRTRMLERLSVARFRTLNESMDSRPSSSTKQQQQQQQQPRTTTPTTKTSTTTPLLPLSNPSTFKQYHEGLSKASSTWKTNPLDHLITWLKSRTPHTSVVADFGCGTATLSSSIPQKTYSLDLHALAPSVIQCDMRNTPLDSNSVDIAIFCLSLMGSEVSEYLVEANRVLKLHGILKIAEVKRRIKNVGVFGKEVEALGFKRRSGKLFYEELEGGVFCLFEFVKVRDHYGDEKEEAAAAAAGGKNKKKKRLVHLDSVVYKKR